MIKVSCDKCGYEGKLKDFIFKTETKTECGFKDNQTIVLEMSRSIYKCPKCDNIDDTDEFQCIGFR